MSLFFCPQCEKETEMLSIQDAANAADVTPRTIHNWKRSGKLHVLETPGRRKLVCKPSMVRQCSNTFDQR